MGPVSCCDEAFFNDHRETGEIRRTGPNAGELMKRKVRDAKDGTGAKVYNNHTYPHRATIE